jgi:hypothetical protein
MEEDKRKVVDISYKYWPSEEEIAVAPGGPTELSLVVVICDGCLGGFTEEINSE